MKSENKSSDKSPFELLKVEDGIYFLKFPNLDIPVRVDEQYYLNMMKQDKTAA